MRHFFNSETKTINSAAAILALAGLFSRFLGLVRDWLLSSTFGASWELDVYFVAFRIPDLIYNVLVAGGIVVAFLPLFSEYFSLSKEKAWEFANNILNVFLFLLVTISLVLFLFTPFLVKLIAPGFNLEELALGIFLTRIILLGPILLGLSSIFSAILQYFNRFLVYALCGLLYNLGIIFGILFLVPFFGIAGVALGVVVGAVFHFLIQIPSAIGCGFKYRRIFSFSVDLKRVFKLMLPRTLATAGQQINLVVITAIASTLSTGSIAIFSFANNIQYFPVGIIGVSFATAIFPALSKTWVEEKRKDFIDKLSLTFCKILYFIVPLSVLFFVLRRHIVDVILRHGQFTQVQADLTSACLGLFCIGIWALALIPLLFRAFFSLQDTKTPTLIALSGIVLNIVLSFYLVWLFGSWGVASLLGLPLAFSLSSIFQLALLMIFLKKRIGDLSFRRIYDSFWRVFTASLIMFLFVSFISNFLSPSVFWEKVIVIFLIFFAGILTYLLSARILKIPFFGKYEIN